MSGMNQDQGGTRGQFVEKGSPEVARVVLLLVTSGKETERISVGVAACLGRLEVLSSDGTLEYSKEARRLRIEVRGRTLVQIIEELGIQDEWLRREALRALEEELGELQPEASFPGTVEDALFA